MNRGSSKLVIISEKVWREAARKHRERIRSILEPGLTSPSDQINSGNRRRQKGKGGVGPKDNWTALDPLNPIYNFLIEYYGIKGSKGTRRLGRWSPDPSLLLNEYSNIEETHIGPGAAGMDDRIYEAAMKASHEQGGIFLENANENDMGGVLHLRGSIPIVTIDNDRYDSADSRTNKVAIRGGGDQHDNGTVRGILYNPAVFYNRHETITSPEDRQKVLKTIAPFQWYASILRTTLSSEPILHCHGLHEWAMQYHPQGAPPPPSAKYQSSLPLRVSREIINETVERKGISCTHVDALRFFAPAAGPLNHHGAELERTDQLRLEQKACVHAHMDLLKIALKLQPFLKAELLGDVLEVAIKARRLDVEASPYDARKYGADIVPVEKQEGRRIYRDRQKQLMGEAEPVRIKLLQAYDEVMKLAFKEELWLDDRNYEKNGKHNVPFIAPERIARAQPGGLPWRQNLIKGS
jgi:hypothetical protein